MQWASWSCTMSNKGCMEVATARATRVASVLVCVRELESCARVGVVKNAYLFGGRRRDLVITFEVFVFFLVLVLLVLLVLVIVVLVGGALARRGLVFAVVVGGGGLLGLGLGAGEVVDVVELVEGGDDFVGGEVVTGQLQETGAVLLKGKGALATPP